MFAHKDVRIDGATVAVANGLQRTLEGLACVRIPKVRLSTVAGKRDEVMMSASATPFQTNCRSGNILQTHISKSEMWGTKCEWWKMRANRSDSLLMCLAGFVRVSLHVNKHPQK